MTQSQGQSEEELLRSVAFQNAHSILAARLRAEEELLQAKQELARSLAMARATLESTTDGILVTDETGHITHFNENVLTLWRLDESSTAGRDHHALIELISAHFRDPASYVARINEIYATSPPESYDLLELADGRAFERFSKIQYVDGRNLGRVWSFRDITERRASELAVQKQSEWLRVTLASIGDGVIACTVGGVVLFVNDVTVSLTGWRADEAVGRPLEEIFQIIDEDSRQPVENPVHRALREGRVVGLANHTILIARDGTENPIDDSAAPIRDERGNLHGVVLVFRGVRERREAERALQQSERELSDFFENASVGLHWVGPDGTILRANRAELDMLGYTRAEYVGHNIAEFHLNKQAIDDILCRLRAGEVLRDYEADLVCKDGSIRNVLIDSSVMWVEDTFVHTRCFTRDVTAQRQLLAALKESDRRKDEFLAILAHELRNPLAPVRNAVEILRMNDDATSQSWATEVIDRQVHQMTRLVDDLLDVSRITRGKITLRKERVQLSAAIQSAVEASRSVIDKWGHTLTMSLAPDGLEIDADLTRLTQVVMNLLNNAAKYTNHGGNISIAAARDGNEAVIEVRDTGIGISAEMLPHVFDMFTQIDRSLERSEGGLGIGLTLVQRLVFLHGGTVHADSEGLGKGSTFTLRLPLATDSSQETATPEDKYVSHAVPPPCRILVVDDNRDAADSLSMLLNTLGNQVRTAYDGQEAVEAAEAFHPDVILLDIGLPKLNGYEAARRIRSQEWSAGTLIIALTGWGQEEDQRRSRDAGFDKHMTKPVEFSRLQNFLREYATKS